MLRKNQLLLILSATLFVVAVGCLIGWIYLTRCARLAPGDINGLNTVALLTRLEEGSHHLAYAQSPSTEEIQSLQTQISEDLTAMRHHVESCSGSLCVNPERFEELFSAYQEFLNVQGNGTPASLPILHAEAEIISHAIMTELLEEAMPTTGPDHGKKETLVGVTYGLALFGSLTFCALHLQRSWRRMKEDTGQRIDQLDEESNAILEGFPHPIYILQNGGVVARRNPAAEALTSALSLSTTDLPEQVRQRFMTCQETDLDYLPDEIEEAILLRRGEDEHWYLPRIFRLKDTVTETGTGWAIALIDVTKVRWMNDVKTDLIGTLSHQLRTPLSSVRMVLHLLAEGKTGDLNPSQNQMIASARKDCERLTYTLDSLLKTAGIDQFHESIQHQDLPPAVILTDALHIFRQLPNPEQLRLQEDKAPDLPNVRGDPQLISQVFSQLLTNAIQHTLDSGQIVVGARQQSEDRVEFFVINRGTAIPAEEQSRIFQQFYRGPGASSAGAGLGLFISQEIIRAHKGKIGVRNLSSNSTEFYFEVPTCMEDPTQPDDDVEC